MERTLKVILRAGEVDLVQDVNDGKYFIRRNVDSNYFDLSNDWKSSQKNKFLTNASRKMLIESIRKFSEEHSDREEVKKFLNWYDSIYKNKAEVQKEETFSNENSSNSEIKDVLNHISKSLEENNKFIRTNILETLADKMISLKAEEVAGKITNSVDKYIKETYGALPQKYEIKLPDNSVSKSTGIYHKELPNIMKFIAADIPLILSGPAGSGKNYTLEKATELLNLDFYFTNAVSQEYKLTGFIDANGKYQETQFYKAFKDGGVFFLDEIDASIPEALIILNAAIANKYFDFPNGRIKAHENFRVVAAANTYGTGSDMIYVGRNVLDGATLDRFALLKFDYDERVEMNCCPDKQLYSFIKSIRKAVEKKNLRYVISIRAMINAYKMLQCGFDKEYIIKAAITKSMNKDDIYNIRTELDKNNDWYTFLNKAYDL